ncbi:MAG: NAD-dependent epimerase/dehydratase family protein [Prochloraceae cyanobacterium]
MTATETNKITIIGCGYVGFAVANFWHDRSHQLTVTTTTPTKVSKLEKIANKVVITKGNNFDRLLEIIEGRDTILLSVGPRRGNPYRETYLETAQNIVKVIQATNNKPKQLIYTSSYSVLGDKKGAWVDENTPLQPNSENGKILAETEKLLLSISNETLKVCILRLGGIYGPGRELIKIFKNWAGTTRPGKGEDYSNWIHLDDIVNAIELARSQRLQGLYHLAGDRPLQTKELFDRLFATHQLPTITWDASSPATRSYNSRLDIQKIKAAGLKLIHPEIEF